MEAKGPNSGQIQYWNEEAGPRWVKGNAMLDTMLEPLGEQAVARADPAPGASVLDVGCGAGATTLSLARRLGPDGVVTGLDISAPLLALARERAAEANLKNTRFELGDAQTQALDTPFDLVFSRFGVMFFADPDAAFANLRRSLRGDGRLLFVCWQEVRRNAWMLEPMLAVAPHVALPEPAPEGAPGPFSLADPERVRGILERAGFKGVALESTELPLQLGGARTVDQAVQFLIELSPIGAVLRDTEDPAPAIDALREMLASRMGSAGIELDAAAWLVTAHA